MNGRPVPLAALVYRRDTGRNEVVGENGHTEITEPEGSSVTIPCVPQVLIRRSQ